MSVAQNANGVDNGIQQDDRYRYYDVPREVFKGLLAAESKGRYMHDHILNRYPYQRLESERIQATG